MGLVLIVDDNVIMAQALAQLARMAGGEAAVLHSGEQALQYIRTHEVALVILDMAMPGLSGLDVLRELAAERRLPALPVVMCSAERAHEAESMRLGAIACIVKDNADELLGLLQQYAGDESGSGLQNANLRADR